MPHAEPTPSSQDARDEELIQQALDPQSSLDFNRDLEPGEKAEDAIDFEDLSDNDLIDEDEDPTKSSRLQAQQDGTGQDDLSRLDGLSSPDHGFFEADPDDLFGENSLQPFGVENLGISPTEDHIPTRIHAPNRDPESSHIDHNQDLRHQDSKDERIQRELFARSRASFAIENLPTPPASTEELLTALWPKYQHFTTPRFMDLLPPKRARYMSRQVPKPPRILHPTKVDLELDQDKEKSFKSSSDARKRAWQEIGMQGSIKIRFDYIDDAKGDSETGSDSESSTLEIPGVSWQDLDMICEDWDAASTSSHEMGTNYMEKRGKPTISYLPATISFPLSGLPSLREPEEATAHIAKRVKIDLNDPDMLVDYIPRTGRSSTLLSSSNLKRLGQSATSKTLSQKYNVSNDEAYDLLKENHQHKIRGMLGNLHIEHSMAALRLQWPFYKTSLEKHEARSFHRPPLRVNRHEQISFSRPINVKRKATKGKDAQALFAQSSDLSLNDNSNVLLLECSEEHPMMLSNLGMGSKIVNHYRKKASDDVTRPKMDIGELNVLLPQDKSPFSLFGQVDPGQTTSAIHNAMYRAPVFRQFPKQTDFLVCRATTGVHGSSWYIRNIENLLVVGQEFPAVDVPGPHSRKTTTASKNRLKMISYRIARRNKSHRINVSEVTRHFISSTDMQNRQKMKEFMIFDKDHKEWKMRPGESIPGEESVRTMVKPEDVCLLESMQVGQQHLEDAGLSKDDDDDASDLEGVKDDENIEQQLAPWVTSRNFLNAAQSKAMLTLHGAGDPSARGEAFSFIKTSMKGGFRAAGESITERMKHKDTKDGTHTYSVADQDAAYRSSIRRIWDAQKRSLSSTVEQSDSDMEEDDFGEASDNYVGSNVPNVEERANRSVRRPDDDSASQSTKWSTNSQSGKILEITRTVRDRFGNKEEIKDISRNPRVIRQYLRRRRALDASHEDVLDIRPGEDDEENKRKELRLKKELARLERNKDRRIARDKQKGTHVDVDGATDADGTQTSPGATPAKAGATLRKCANCGMVGHIKTNKKLCPMLNGSHRPEDGFSITAFSSGAPAL